VDGPIYNTSTQVYVDNVLPDSTVTVYKDSTGTNLVGTATSTSPGAIWVPLTKPIAVGEFLTARQLYTGSDPKIAVTGVSLPSNVPVPVLPVPVPLPSPIFSSGLCTCMDSVWIDGLIPGATLTILLESPTTPPTTTTVVNAKANQTPEWFQLAAVPIAANSVLKAQQSVGAAKSSVVTSYPIPSAPALGKPDISPPPLDCQTSLGVSNLVPGADLKITNGADEAFGTNPWSSYTVDGLFPLQVGAVNAQQYYTRCDDQKPGPTGSATVAKQAPKFPKVKYAPCADITQLSVSNLISGEILTVEVSYSTTSGPVVTSLGSQGVSGESSSVNLPPGWYPTDATGPVTLRIEVLLCDASLPSPGYTPVVVGQTGGPYPAPTILPPLFDCATTVNIVGAHVGSLIQVFSGSTAFPRCNPLVATTANFPIKLWTPLSTGESIFATQQGCNAKGQSGHVTVQPIPSRLPIPRVVGPVLAGAKSVAIGNVVPGAQVTLFVDGAPRMGIDSAEEEITLPAGTPPVVEISMPTGSPPLVAGETLTAGQALCAEIGIAGPDQGLGVKVQAPVPAPPPGTGDITGGLGSDSNYIMYAPTTSGGCQSLLNVSVTIDVTEPIVFVSASGGPTQGFAFQMNCYSPKGKYCAWQQYIIALLNTELTGLINTWPLTGNPIIAPPDNSYPVNLVGLPSVQLPAGYQMKIILGNDPSGNVDSVTWVVNGTTYPTQNIPAILTSFGLPTTDVAPIVAFEMNLVDPIGGESAVLSSGAGTFTYSASSPLTVYTSTAAAEYPACVEFIDNTGETTNSTYGVLPANPGNPFTQSFTVSPTKPAIPKSRGPLGHWVRPPRR
jgi:hypothetical protein